ncbi:MAG: hypothetical protein PVJ86_02515, partial [Phycisphaerales bacterium]
SPKTGIVKLKTKVPDCHHVAFFREYEINRNSRLSGKETLYGSQLARARDRATPQKAGCCYE